MPTVALILPSRETFAPNGAGAIALVAERLARASSWRTVVIGRAVAAPFAGFRPVKRHLPYGLAVIGAVRRLRPDLVEVHNRPLLACALSWWHPRVALVLHNDPTGMRGMRTAAGRARIGRHLTGIAAVSSWVAGRAAPAAASVLPNGIELPPLSGGERPRIVAFAGRMVADKGADVFVDAMAATLADLPGWRAVMVGADRFGTGSPETPFLRALRPRAAAIGVDLLGWQPHATVLDVLQRASIAVVPSRWAEPFGLAALEAMATGAALVHTGTGGLAELVGDAGVRVTPGDALELGLAVAEIARNPARRQALSEAGVTRAALFAMDRVAARVDAWRAGLLDHLPSRHRRPISPSAAL